MLASSFGHYCMPILHNMVDLASSSMHFQSLTCWSNVHVYHLLSVLESYLLCLSFRPICVHVCMSICPSFAAALATVLGRGRGLPFQFKSTIACFDMLHYFGFILALSHLCTFACCLASCIPYPSLHDREHCIVSMFGTLHLAFLLP